MLLSDRARRLGETVLIVCVVTVLTGAWAHGTADSKAAAHLVQTKGQVLEIAQALRMYYIDHGRYPQVSGGKSFCFPFNKVGRSICLSELVGPYINVDSVPFNQNTYVYYKESGHVIVAADIPLAQDVSTSSRCSVAGIDFWCVKLLR